MEVQSIFGFRYPLLSKGDLVALTGDRNQPIPLGIVYRHEGTARIRWGGTPDAVQVNGKVVGVDLRRLTEKAGLAALIKHRTTVQSVAWHSGTRLTPALLQGLGQLVSKRLVLWIEARGGAIPKTLLAVLKPLAARIDGLMLSGTGFADAHLGPLSQVPSLRALFLWNTKVTGPGLDALKGLKGFASLRIQSFGFRKTGYAYVAALARLQHFAVVGPEADKEAVALLGRLRGLRRLSISLSSENSGVPANTLSGVTTLPRLHTLDISGLKEAHLPTLAKAKGLHVLDLSYAEITDAGLRHLAGLTWITHLNLASTSQIQGEGFKHLSKLAKLRDLKLDEAKITDAGLVHLGKLKSLRRLSLYSCGKITDAGLKSLAGLKNLQHLDLSNVAAGTGAMRAIGKLTGLTHLSIPLTKPTDAGLAHLSRLAKLRELHLAATEITDAGLRHLAGLRALQLLSLRSNKITAKGLARLLPRLKKLQVLDISGTGMGDDGLAVVGRSSTLTRLHVSENPITDGGLAKLAGLRALETLDLDKTKISGAGFSKLTGLRRLLRIDLNEGLLDAAGAKQVARLTSLRYLRLMENRIDDAAVKLLLTLPKLGLLQLYGNQKVTEAVVEAVRKSGILWIDLGRTGVSKDARANLAKQLPRVTVK